MYKLICECGEVVESEEKALNGSDFFECLECGNRYYVFDEEDLYENECFECEKLIRSGEEDD